MATKIDYTREDWAPEIGRMFIAFGSIESTVDRCLKVLPRDPIHPVVTRLNLAVKVDLLLAVLAIRPEAVALHGTLVRIKALAAHRNHIAHNPLVFEFYENGTGHIRILEVIQSLRSPNATLTFERLRELRLEAEELSATLLQSSPD